MKSLRSRFKALDDVLVILLAKREESLLPINFSLHSRTRSLEGEDISVALHNQQLEAPQSQLVYGCRTM